MSNPAATEKFAFNEQFDARNRKSPKEELAEAVATAEGKAKQTAEAQFQQQLQQELATRDAALQEAAAQLEAARIAYQQQLQAEVMQLGEQLVRQLAGSLQEKLPENFLQAHLPALLEQIDEGIGGTVECHPSQQELLAKSFQHKAWQMQPANSLQPGTVRIRYNESGIALDLTRLTDQLVEILQTGKAAAPHQPPTEPESLEEQT